MDKLFKIIKALFVLAIVVFLLVANKIFDVKPSKGSEVDKQEDMDAISTVVSTHIY